MRYGPCHRARIYAAKVVIDPPDLVIHQRGEDRALGVRVRWSRSVASLQRLLRC